ncbi:hypothetical protein HPB58_10980 [Priestia filamentosa]|uniref:hypothetical protein n=1 Tax=Priestia filamentosa TaxID=1402861 RepID=UPI001FB44272|nr:hypothetical protein [Priestia filamentosa]MED3727802.1 hypothetical protein [Priestia filamentosa]UOE62653.1 hypothetical protein HPB58_10980 [Priestia filamentosa]
MYQYSRKKTFSLAMIIIPWLTVPFMGKKAFFRFLPVASFINLFLSLLSLKANKRRWWMNKNPLSPGSVDFSYILGPYYVATLWIFKLTYGNFPKYLLTNMILDFINAFPFASIWEKVGIFKFQKMKHLTWYFICVCLAVLIYGYQYLVERAIRQTNNAQPKL